MCSLRENQELPKGLKLEADQRTQYGALCYRFVRGKVRVLLVTSRSSRRWIIPKGWPIDSLTPVKTAAVEAWEEGGVRGKAENRCIGYYSYTKYAENGGKDLPCVVCVFPIRVKSLAKDFPERGQRRRKWFSPKQASKKVAEPELRELLRSFDPT